MIRAPVGQLFNRFGNLSIYYVLIAQGLNFSSVSYFKCFGTSQLEFEKVKLYINKVNLSKDKLYFTP